MTPQHFGKCIVAHLLDLFALIAVYARPDVYGIRTGLRHFRQNFLERQRAVHRRGEDVIEPKLRFRSQRGHSGEGGGSANELTAGEHFHVTEILRPFSKKGAPKCIGSVSPGRRMISGENCVTYARRIWSVVFGPLR